MNNLYGLYILTGFKLLQIKESVLQLYQISVLIRVVVTT
jgi:hypothetical protein